MDQVGPMEILGILTLVVYAAWLYTFFSTVRQRLLAAVGRRLMVDVKESSGLLDSGLYTTVGPASLRQSVIITLSDMVVTLLGTVGMAALWFIPIFLAVEYGLIDPLQSLLTGRRVTLELPPTITMRASQPTQTVALVVRNDGGSAERQCGVSLADYTARDGYLSARTPLFDLAAHGERALPLPLEGIRPPVGRHTVRVRVECTNRRLTIKPLVVIVEP